MHTPSRDGPPPEKCTKYCTKTFGGRAPPGPTGGAYSAPPDLYLRGRQGRRKARKGEGRKGENEGGRNGGKGGDGKGGRYPTPFRFSGYAHDSPSCMHI